MTAFATRLVFALAVALPLFAGCRRDLTQVVLVIESDMSVPTDVDGTDVVAIDGPFAPPNNPFFSGSGSQVPFPQSVGFESGGRTTTFSITVRLFKGVSQTPTPTLVVSRTVTDIRFVDGETMMLVLPMNRTCACQGTSCPTLPECDNIEQPTLVPFDPAVAPPSSTISNGTVTPGGPPTRQPADAF
jgi:hypothetical protein